MATTKVLPVVGNIPASGLGSKKNYNSGKGEEGSQHIMKYVYISHNFADYINYRSHGLSSLQYQRINRSYAFCKLMTNGLFEEKLINIGSVNKVFSSQWLNDHQIMIGTKCNKLLIYNTLTERLDHIPSLQGSRLNTSNRQEGGVHSIALNPSKTLLATGALNCNDIAVYKLPVLDPYCVGEDAHNDFIFDMCWLDDVFLVSASRDTKLALWKVNACSLYSVPDNDFKKHFWEYDSLFDFPNSSFVRPIEIATCNSAEKFRALLFNPFRNSLLTLSLNGYIHLWDIFKFQPYTYSKLPITKENVCMAQSKDYSLYVVGSKYQAFLWDIRLCSTVQKIEVFTNLSAITGIRSLSFIEHLVTVGTGGGSVVIYDVRTGKALTSSMGQPVELYCCHSGRNVDNPPAVYTHAYDKSGTRLFTAGGPLESALWGNYAALWL